MVLSDTAAGYLWVAGAIFFFGTFGLPVKIPAVQRAKVDPVVFQCYYSLAVFLSSWLVLFIQPFEWTWYGTMGACIWVPSSVLAITGINLIGMAVAQGVWSGATIIISFLWGVIAFQEEIENWYLTVLALFLLILGIVGISLCNQQWKVQIPSSIEFLYKIIPCLVHPSSEIENESEELAEEESQYPEKHNSSLNIENNTEKNSSKVNHNYVLGIGACLLLGLMNGSMLVPSELTPSELQGISYVLSFSIGVAMVTTVLAPTYFFVQWARGAGKPKFHFRVAVLPGLASGLIWNAGNICSIYATLYLGMTIGFPLTQMALLVSALWGMILFREITRVTAIMTFFISAFVLLTGAVLLSLYA